MAEAKNMAESEKDEFYVGYLPEAPTGIARQVRMAVIGLIGLAIVVGAVLVIGQRGFRASFFEFGNEREFTGLLMSRPYPMLLVARPAATGSLPAHSRYALVAPGKHGADQMVRAFDNHQVRLRGTLIHSDGASMIEIVPDSIEVLPSSGEGGSRQQERLGERMLIGEIVDSKCYLGVMNPGEGKVHRDCAVRCISGGIPPLFIVRNEAGERTMLWLVGDDGEQIGKRILHMVAEPVAITGEVRRIGDQLYMRAATDNYRRLR